MEADGDAMITARWAAAAFGALRRVISKIGPTVLFAQQDDCVEDGGDPDNPPEEPCEIPPIPVEGEDPYDDDYGYYDDYWDECVCYNGEEWGDPEEWEEPCQYSPPDDPDPTDPGGGGDPGDDDGDGDEPPPPPCPDPTVQTLVEEYPEYQVAINPMPDCDDFADPAILTTSIGANTTAALQMAIRTRLGGWSSRC